MSLKRLALALLLCAAPGTRGWAQSETDLIALRATLDQAVSEFEGPQQGQSLVRFEEIIGRLEAERRQGSLTESGATLLVKAYEYRARVQFNLGNTDKAGDSFRALIALRPQHNLDAASISPKVIDFFKGVKSKIIGFVTVQSVPQGATVALNGKPLSVTDFFPLEVVAGDYTLDITKNGYRPETRPVTVAAGETLSLQFDLVRTSATGYVITEPTDVEIFIDGVRKGSTTGVLDPALAAIAAARGLDPAKSSSRLEIPDLPSGSHTIEFRHACYETLKLGLDVPEPQDYDIPPIKLEPSIGTISLTSDPPGGQIFIDGESQGVAPKTLRSVCAGVRRVEVRHAAGRFVQDVDLKARATVELAAQIRPTLAFLGVVADGPSGERSLASMESRLARVASATIKAMNFLKADAAALERTLSAERLKLVDLLPPGKPDPALVRRVFEKLAAALEVQGFLVGRIPEEQLSRSALLHVFAAGSVVPDSASVVIEDDSSYARFFAAFEKKVPLRAPWSGLVTVDTLLHEGPVVLRVVPGSPADKAAFVKGHVITAAGGRPVTKTEELLSAIAAAGTSKPLSITANAAGGPKTVDLLMEDAPREISFQGAGVLANKISMDLRQTIEGYPGSANAAFARLNLGLIALGLHDFSGAHDSFIKAKNELPSGPGLSRGTAAFYAGVALEHLGYSKEALDEYTQASQDAGATLLSQDGPKVQDIAKRRIAALSGAR
ncbi:MAG: PEGA domain-containing protein [Vicinamibacteria bacterium]|nr:PEGA domain-containing protein [Vicinamibacteria bacterium]